MGLHGFVEILAKKLAPDYKGKPYQTHSLEYYLLPIIAIDSNPERSYIADIQLPQ